ncbi:MAG: BMP family ABC transporter substrate-binding protein, partial [Candidatus Aminicenantes bacterium]|nr:BMP family ABC transporter substrate-binding protein [Candidatus Aminicenantes bacterium]
MARIKTIRPVGLFIVLSLLFAGRDVAAPAVSARTAGRLKVALIFDLGGRGDGGFNDSAYRGLDRAVKELGIEAVLREPRRNLEREMSLNEAAASDAGLIIGVGFNFSDRMSDLAARFPGKKFVCVDYGRKYDLSGRPVPLPANLAGLRFKEEEGSYLVGLIAALKSRTGRIGFLGGMDGPIIRKFEAGYAAGARSVRPRIVILSRFAGITARAFNDPAKGYEIATAMFKENADVVYHAAGATGAGLFRAAREAKRWAIGVDVDQSAQAPGLVLTSMTKNVDVAVFETIKAAAQGRFSGGLHTFGLKEDGVGFILNDLNRGLIPAEAQAEARSARERIITGKISVPTAGAEKPRLEQRELQAVLFGLKVEIASVIDLLDAELRRGAEALSVSGLVGVRARDVLRRLYETQPYIIDCEAASDRGIMLT